MKKLVMMLSLVMLLGVVSVSAANTKHKRNKNHHPKTEAAAPAKKAPAKK